MHPVADAGSCVPEDFLSPAGVTPTVPLTAGIQTHLVDGTEGGGEGGEGRGEHGGGREGSEGRRSEGEVEGGEGGPDSGRSGGGGVGGGGPEGATGVRTGGGGEMLGSLGRISKMFLSVLIVSIYVGASLLKTGECKMRGVEGESSKEQSAGEMMVLGSNWSSTVLETVGKVEKEE